MTKKLLLIRHAKSDWSTPNCSDFNRPLNERGENDVILMAIALLNRKLIPELIISSPAVRAISTAKSMVKEWGINEESIQLNKSIYEASCDTLLKIVNNLDSNSDLIALFGHNNSITDLAVYLTEADIFNIPTCGAVLISFPFEDWKMISKKTGLVEMYDYPKNLKSV
jgi:phosphohistidine phosphatase